MQYASKYKQERDRESADHNCRLQDDDVTQLLHIVTLTVIKNGGLLQHSLFSLCGTLCSQSEVIARARSNSRLQATFDKSNFCSSIFGLLALSELQLAMSVSSLHVGIILGFWCTFCLVSGELNHILRSFFGCKIGY